MSRVVFTAAIISFLQLLASNSLDAQVKSNDRPAAIKIVIDEGHSYRIETCELRLGRLEPITTRRLDDRASMLLDPIISRLTTKLVSPPFIEENGRRDNAAGEEPTTRIVIQEETPNRRREISFAAEYARRLGLKEEIVYILSLANVR